MELNTDVFCSYWCSFVSAIANWLSEKSVVVGMLMPKIEEIREQSHRASFAAWTAATYSLSVVEREMISCLFALQETAPPLIRKAYPEIVEHSY